MNAEALFQAMTYVASRSRNTGVSDTLSSEAGKLLKEPAQYLATYSKQSQ
ncbi:hypothetical protein [Vulcanisaeta souniana]|nr:hypothetical protein [Vulcanisaeta souniana]